MWKPKDNTAKLQLLDSRWTNFTNLEEIITKAQAQAILGVHESASAEEIRSAFHKKALVTHSDHNRGPNSDAEFRQLRRAFDLLRSQHKTTERETNQLHQLPPNVFQLKLTLEQILHGGSVRKTITRKIPCSDPLDDEDYEEEEVQLEVSFEAGVLHNKRITFPNEGDRHRGKVPANVVFEVVELAHPLFQRCKRTQLEHRAELSAEEACQGVVWIPTLDGELIRREVNELITDSTVITLPGRGLPAPSAMGGQVKPRGDLTVKFKVFYDPIDREPERVKDLWLNLEQMMKGVACMEVPIQRTVVDAESGTSLRRVEHKILGVSIPPGTPEGHRIRLHQKGDQFDALALPADLFLAVRYRPHPTFRMLNQVDLEQEVLFTESELQIGKTLTIHTLLKGEVIRFSLGNLVNPRNGVETFIGRGLPFPITSALGSSNRRGNMIVRFRMVPQAPPMTRNLYLTERQRTLGQMKFDTITRKVIDHEDGTVRTEPRTLLIVVPPDSELYDNIVVAREGDHIQGGIPADVVYVIMSSD